MSPADSVWVSTLEQFSDRTAGASPTPGGGAVAAVRFGFAVSFVLMCREIAKKSHGEFGCTVRLYVVEEARGRSRKCADEDNAAHNKYDAVSRLPSGEAAESACRDSARSAALVKVTNVSLGCAHAAVDLAQAPIEELRRLILSSTLCGWATAQALIRVALAPLLFTVAMNLWSLDRDKPEGHGPLLLEYEVFQSRGREVKATIGRTLEGVSERLRVVS